MKTIILGLVLSLSVNAAIQAGMQWDVRTTGADTNGGGFDSTVVSPGTDESLTDAGTAYVDVIIGATTTQGTSALQPFTATTHGPGNVFVIASGVGCTTGRFEMLSQSSGIATFDRSLGTAASVCTGVFGGTFLTVNKPSQSLMVDGNTVHIKSGTYSGTILNNVSDITLKRIFYTGYGVTHNDGGTRPLLTIATNTILVQANSSNPAVYFTNINFSSTSGTRNDGINAGGLNMPMYVINCSFDGFRYAIFGDNGARGYFGMLFLFNVEIKNSTTGGVYTVGELRCYGCNIHNNTGDAIGITTSVGVVERSIITTNTRGVVSGGNNTSISESTIASNSGTGIFISGASSYNTTIFNNIIYGNGGWGVNFGTAYGSTANPSLYSLEFNAYGANTSGNILNGPPQTSDITLTASPFVSSTNFALNATAGGGVLLTKTGFPGVFSGGLSTGFLDVGAVQTSGGVAAASQNSYGTVQ
jgi:hypothetical protein